uniref:GTP-dependent dephospho-CoA kinase n=1 Tax=Thermosphaera aggregans TaxID=54254 RepID=A0A7C2BKE8_9CREN
MASAGKNIPCLKPPDYLRKTLSLPQGKLYVSDKHAITGLSCDAAVGDVVSRNHYARIRVVDYKTKRSVPTGKGSAGGRVFRVVNPPGCVSLNSFTISFLKNEHVVEVVGEEDLLVFPLALPSTGVYRIIYGQPSVGVVELDARGVRVLKLLKTFKPVNGFI